MIEPNQPESAFPSTFKSLHPEEQQVHRWGMQLRDYFAAKAMHQLINTGMSDEMLDRFGFKDAVAMHAYDMADAMLRAREAK